MRKKIYPSKKAKRRAEFAERQKRRELERALAKSYREATTLEEAAKALGIRLK